MNSNSTTIFRRIPRISLGPVWLLGWLMLAAWFGFGHEWLKHNPAPAQAAVSPRPSALTPPPKLEAVAISKMKVGDQVPADNPTGENDTEFGDTVDPTSWRKLVLLASKKDGSLADVELLRPLWWLEEQQATVGDSVNINVPECGIEGKAQVLAIEPCPTIKHDSRFRIVTGTFKHQASKVLDVYVEGLDEPIGTTPNHPFWSEDRQSFVHADELKEGEHLRAFNGTPIVRRIVPLADPEPVFNLEIQCDHVYHVARDGVLVHNSGALCPDWLRRMLGSDEAVLLGRDMGNRVEPAATYLQRATGSNAITTYNAPRPTELNGVQPIWHNADGSLTELGRQSVQLNRIWLQQQITAGRRVLDIGGNSGMRPSAWYDAELQVLRDMGLTRQFRGMIDVGGTLRPLWEWIPLF